jgi:predicted nucleic acid-binding protein
MAADAIFIDTNVLVFATIPSSPFHQPAIAALHALAQTGVETWISRQVVREYLVQLTRPGVLPLPLSAQLAGQQAETLTTLYRVADENGAVFRELLTLLRAGLASGKQVHDANVVATCLAWGIPRLLTHNVADFQRFSAHVRVEGL